jgi:alkylation response protein AidB-like acyl-CoA dehydrogenase
MRYLGRERDTVEKYLPGLDDLLAGTALTELERPGSPGVKAFRDHGGPALVIPTEYGGSGADALDAVRVQRAIGARSPSLAVATTMHHFSVAGLVVVADGGGQEWLLLEAIAKNNMLLASGFAEGRPDGKVLQPTMAATVTADGIRISGVKRPCSLAQSMDLLTASVAMPTEDGGTQLAVALIPANDPGVTVSPFWSSFALAGAESDQVTIDDVLVPPNLVVRTRVPEGEHLDDIQTAAFVWFELLMMGSYLGAASALVERVVASEHIADSERMRLVTGVEGAMAAIENVARQVAETAPEPASRRTDEVPVRRRTQELLVDSLLVRYHVQDTIAAVVPRAVELLGGLNFMTGDDVGYLAAAVNGLGFHPPARAKMAGPLTSYLAGGPLDVA